MPPSDSRPPSGPTLTPVWRALLLPLAACHWAGWTSPQFTLVNEWGSAAAGGAVCAEWAYERDTFPSPTDGGHP